MLIIYLKILLNIHAAHRYTPCVPRWKSNLRNVFCVPQLETACSFYLLKWISLLPREQLKIKPKKKHLKIKSKEKRKREKKTSNSWRRVMWITSLYSTNLETISAWRRVWPAKWRRGPPTLPLSPLTPPLPSCEYRCGVACPLRKFDIWRSRAGCDNLLPDLLQCCLGQSTTNNSNIQSNNLCSYNLLVCRQMLCRVAACCLCPRGVVNPPIRTGWKLNEMLRTSSEIFRWKVVGTIFSRLASCKLARVVADLQAVQLRRFLGVCLSRLSLP